MTKKIRFFRVAHLLFLALCLIGLLPDKVPDAPLYTLALAGAAEAALLVFSALAKRRGGLDLLADIIAVLYALLLAWTLATAKFSLIRPLLFPPPGIVLRQFVTDAWQLSGHVKDSLLLILTGYALALAAAIPLGLLLGYSARAGATATYISKFLGAIPPVVYIPYGIALLPTFRSVSVLVIFLASFWPVLAGTVSGVMYVERQIVNSARVLNVNRSTMLFKIILPAALPQIFIGCNQGLTVSFVLLTSAEMIGARSGMGYYVKNYSDLGNYTRTIVGVVLIGIVISLVFFLFNKLQKYMLRWKS